jgi:hypothetical protein
MRFGRFAFFALAAGLILLSSGDTTARVGKALAKPAPRPVPMCADSLTRELAVLEQILDDYTRNGWSQAIQDDLDALVGSGFTLAQRSSEAFVLEAIVLEDHWDDIQVELDQQRQMSPSKRSAYQAGMADLYACSVFGSGAALRAGIPLKTSLLAVIAATAAALQDGDVDDDADDALFPEGWPTFEIPPDPPEWIFEPGVPFDGCFTLTKPISEGFGISVFVCDFNEGGAEPDYGGGIGLRWSF